MSDKIRVLIVDDHPLFRDGLRQAIERDSGLEVVGEAGDGKSGLRLAIQLRPNVAVLDIGLPQMNGLDLAREIVEQELPVGIVILTMHSEEKMFNAAMDRGARGYVLKENASTDIVGCVKTVASGGHYLTASISSYLLRRSTRASQLRKKVPSIEDLTVMEKRILSLIAENKSSKEIGEALFISPRTVGTHRTNISLKLGLHGSHGLIQFALQHRSEL
jgi:DNA-binding NarL/FixJ family response regulator